MEIKITRKQIFIVRHQEFTDGLVGFDNMYLFESEVDAKKKFSKIKKAMKQVVKGEIERKERQAEEIQETTLDNYYEIMFENDYNSFDEQNMESVELFTKELN